MDDETTIAELTERVAMLEALVEKLAGEEPTTPPAPITPRSGGDDTTTASTPTTAGRPLPRRQMLGKAGAAAVGAVLGGAVAAVSTASPAAAASGSFDSSTSDPALTAISTGSGAAIKATSSGSGRALDVDGSSQLRGQLEIMTSATTGLQITSTGVGVLPDTGIQASASSVGVIADGAQWGVHGASDGVGVFGHGGNGYGILAVGAKANLHLMEPGDPYPAMVPPRSRTDAHESGEIYLDSNSDLWLCVADGTPGTWIHLGGPASSGTFTVLHRPVRVYTATAVTGIIHGIDLTTASSGVPTDATAAVITVNITNTTAQANSFCKVFADDLTTPPPTTAVRWRDAKELIANSVTTRLAAAKIATQINGQANLAIDVVGYYR
jgi:hypothetical protein